MNRYNLNASIEDALSHFVTLGKDQLEDLAREIGLSAKHADLIFCQNYFRTKEQRSPTFDELCLIDGIIRQRKAQLSRSALSEIKIDDKYILATYNELSEKWLNLRSNNAPLSFDSASCVVSLEATSNEKIPPRGVCSGDAEHRYTPLRIVDEKGKCVCYRAVNQDAQARKPDANTALVLITPKKEQASAEYEQAVGKLVTDARISNIIVLRQRISNAGIAATLARLTSLGIFADLTRLPLPASTNVLCEDFHNCILLATTRENTDLISTVANEHGLLATYFAKVTSSTKFALAKDGNPSINLGIGFISRLAEGLDNTAFTLEHEDFSEVCAHKTLYTDIPPKPISTLVFGNGMIISPVYTIMSENCFSMALNTVIDSVLGLMCAGASMADASLTIEYTLPTLKSTEKNNGKALAMLLGAYRAMTELGISDVDSRLTYAKADTFSISCAAFAKAYSMPKGQQLTGRGNYVYYLGFARNDDLTPKFDSIEQLWNFVFQLFVNDKVASATTVFGSVAEGLNKMNTDGLRADITDEGRRLESIYAQGLLIECTKKLKFPEVAIVR